MQVNDKEVRKPILKSNGPHTVGYVISPVEASNNQDISPLEGPLVYDNFAGLFQSRSYAGFESGTNHISYSQLPANISKQRRAAVLEYRKAVAAKRLLLQRKLKEWRALRAEYMSANLRKEVERSRVSYLHAIIDLDPRYYGDTLQEVQVHNPHAKTSRNGILRSAGDFLELFQCSRYTLNPTFSAIPEHVGSPAFQRGATSGSRVKDGWTPIYTYEILPGNAVDHYKRVVGQVRWERKSRRMTAKERRIANRKLLRGKMHLLARGAKSLILGRFLREHPHPSYRDPEFLELNRRIHDAQKAISSLVSYQRCTASKVVDIRGGEHKLVFFSPSFSSAECAIPCALPAVEYNPSTAESSPAGALLAAYPKLDDPRLEEEYNMYSPVTHSYHTVKLRSLLNSAMSNGTELTVAVEQHEKSVSVDEGALVNIPSAAPVSKFAYLRQNGQIADLVRQLELGEIPKRLGDNIARTAGELKDMPQTINQGFSFLTFLLGRRGRVIPFGSAARTMRSAAQGYLWWKFGVQPTIADVNKLCDDAGQYLSSWRRGMQQIVSAIQSVIRPVTAKRRKVYHVRPDVPPTPEVPASDGYERTYWVYLPVLPSHYLLPDYLPELVDVGASTNDRWTLRRPVRWMDGGPLTTSLPNVEFLLRDLYSYATSAAAGALRELVSELLIPTCPRVLFDVLEDTVFARYSEQDIRRVLGLNETSPLYMAAMDTLDTLRPFTTSWELTPLSFVVDWFFTTRETIRALERELTALVDKRMTVEKDVWLSRRLVYWPVMEKPTFSIGRVCVGTLDYLRRTGVACRDCPWTMDVEVPVVDPEHISAHHSPDSPGWRHLVEFYNTDAVSQRYSYDHSLPAWPRVYGRLPILAVQVKEKVDEWSAGYALHRSVGYVRCPVKSGDERLLPRLDIKASIDKLGSLIAILASSSKVSRPVTFRAERGAGYQLARLG